MPVTIGGSLSFCGRELQPQELDLIRQITRDFSTLSLTELAHTVCELLEWRRPNGGLKGRECSCRPCTNAGGCLGCHFHPRSCVRVRRCGTNSAMRRLRARARSAITF